MKVKGTLLILLLAAGFFGCGRQHPRHIVILVDVSGSIDRNALAEAFKAIDGLVGNLRRGDRVAIIPILGDAEAETSGRILRLDVPTTRQAYDSDLRRFQAQLKTSLEEMKRNAIAHPGAKTDILGTLELAGEEFQLGPSGSNKLLAVLSDFLQEDNELRFQTDQRVATPSVARRFAVQTAQSRSIDLARIPIYLGLLKSSEFSALTANRRSAIRTFWLQYLLDLQARPQFVVDGSGLILEHHL